MDTMRTLFKLSSRSGNHSVKTAEVELLSDNTALHSSQHENFHSDFGSVGFCNQELLSNTELIYEKIMSIDIKEYMPIESVLLQELDIEALRNIHLEAIESIGKINMVASFIYKNNALEK